MDYIWIINFEEVAYWEHFVYSIFVGQSLFSNIHKCIFENFWKSEIYEFRVGEWF